MQNGYPNMCSGGQGVFSCCSSVACLSSAHCVTVQVWFWRAHTARHGGHAWLDVAYVAA